MGAAALGNALSRSTLPASFQRVVFASQQATPLSPVLDGFATQYVDLSEANVFNALMASGAIPYVFEGVYEIEGAGELHLRGAMSPTPSSSKSVDRPFRNNVLELWTADFPRNAPKHRRVSSIAWQRVRTVLRKHIPESIRIQPRYLVLLGRVFFDWMFMCSSTCFD